ncbi:SprB repeat-containing protein, partial [Bacteroidota bacterium]
MNKVFRALLFSVVLITAFLVIPSNTQAQCPVVIDSIVASDVTCSGANDGTICIYISGGSPNYTYQIFNGPLVLSSGPQTDSSYCFNGLGSGITDYQVIVVGENGAGGSCPAAIGFTIINDPPPFAITITTTDESCPDANDGEATVSVSGGVAPYTYAWPPFAETNDSISGLDGGIYSVIVTDDNQCSQSKPYSIATSPDWIGSLTKTNPTCWGGSNGFI